MSGIAAILHFDGRPADRAALSRMTAAMDYRGPDGINHWHSGSAAIGHCAMHSAAGSQEAKQPWADEDQRLIVVLDGYLSNPDELKAKLQERGCRIRNRSDAELVLRAYQSWGQDCPRHIDGEFAFLIWDCRERSAFCARDHQGLRPLFYHQSANCLIVSTDFAPIHAALDAAPEPNEEVLVQLCTGQWYSRAETIWEGIERILPAHSLCFSAGSKASRCYWELPEAYSIRYSSDADYAAHYDHVLSEAVRRASRSQKPVGFEVSGGLDSSSIFAFADRLHKDGALRAPEMRGYALAGPIGSDADEAEYFEAVSRHLNLPIQSSPLFMPALDWFVEQSRRDADLPYFPNGAMNITMYKTMAQDGCRVALNGLGGDEWTRGLPTYYRDSLKHRDWAQIKTSFTADASAFGYPQAVCAFLRYGLVSILPDAVKAAGRRLTGKDAASVNPLPSWLTEAARMRLSEGLEQHEAFLQEGPNPGPKKRIQTFPLNMFLLEQANRLRAQCGIEGRSPMLSRDFIEFSAATPEAIRLRGGKNRFMHRQCLSGLLPENVVNRSGKAEFSITLEKQLESVRSYLLQVAPLPADKRISSDGSKALMQMAGGNWKPANWKWAFWGLFGAEVLALSQSSGKGIHDGGNRTEAD